MSCPICGSEEAKKVGSGNNILGPGGYWKVKYYICEGCSVIFQDKEKFYNQSLNTDVENEDCA